MVGLLVVVLLQPSIPAAVATGAGRREPIRSQADLTTPLSGQLASVATLPDLPVAALQNSRLPGSIDNDRRLLLGSVGSDLWRSPADPPGEFWMVTDRGPNDRLQVDGESRRVFPVPEYTPHILKVRVEGSAIVVVDAIPIVGQSGRPVTGLPNTEAHEEPYDYDGQTRLAPNPSGLDVEGVVRTASGDFWAVEEYGPSLVHIDASGRVLRRFVPRGSQIEGADYPVVAALPAIFNLRTLNRGFEGLTLSPDGSTLYLAIQSPLSNPDATTGSRSRLLRILAFDIAGEQVVAEYAYAVGWTRESTSGPPPDPQPKPERATNPSGEPKPERPAKPERATKPFGEPKPERVARAERAAKPERAARPTSRQTRLSALAPVGPSTLLVLERTESDTRLYLAEFGDASNILGSPWDDLSTAPSLEAVDDPAAAGLTPLTKTPIVDLSTIPELPGKLEGLAIVDSATVAVANDNDFDMGTFDGNGNNVGSGRRSQIVMVTLPRSLP